MNHDVFAHSGAWIALAVNVVGLGVIVWRGGLVIGALTTSVKSLASSVTELKAEVATLREELGDQGKAVARIEGAGYAGPERRVIQRS